ncbi:uncharacterized protein LOC117336493 isoform X11 [Pecten maximus]|uniref:uncharacterized protein LOC117336493 isoform X11 n=1 Tax=Pecten maximus TaxID=6579 RepID=UPI001458DD56|nr:uncharacterized protein LOC117336493 isoform X11 [Pecten maximus]
MSSMNYQKVYMNQIHSSSLLCQLSHMWKSQMLCDAIIKTGQIITKAHRVVLVAACPMLQSMENASAGSHLEVRLAADIKQESVNTFLQYLYEGFMMLTEENVRDVEKVARLLQVDSVIKCCADFYKCMNAKTGAPFPGSAYKYSFSGHDLAEFRHVRATGLQKTASERIIKRVSDFPRPGSPGSKRPRLHRGGSPSDVTVIGSDKADDTASMSHSYMAGAPDPWDRVPKLGSGMGRQGATGRNSQPGVIEIVEESIELVQTEPPEKDSGQSSSSSSRSSQRSAAVSIAVTSQFNTEPDISVVNVFGNPDTQSSTPAAATNTITSSSSSRGSITVSPLTIFQDPHPPSSSGPEPPSSSTVDSSSGQDQQRLSEMQFSGFSQRQDMDSYSSGKQKSGDGQLSSTPQQRPFPMSMSPINQPKPFAAGSAMQAGMSSPSSMSLPLGSPSSSKSVQKPRSAPASPAERARDNRRASEAAGMQSTADMTPDLSIVKIEASNHETGGLDMHVDMPEEGVMRIHQGRMPDDQDDTSDKEIEDWAREEMSNEGSNISGDQNNSWYMGTFKDPEPSDSSNMPRFIRQPPPGKRPLISENFGLTPELLQSFMFPKYNSQGRSQGQSLDVSQARFQGQSSNTMTPIFSDSMLRHHESIVSPDSNLNMSVGHSTSSYRGQHEYGQHKLVYIADKKYKPCVVCVLNKVKSPKGWYIYSYYKCEVCDVPLCRSKRDCFHQYHQYMSTMDNSELQITFPPHTS